MGDLRASASPSSPESSNHEDLQTMTRGAAKSAAVAEAARTEALGFDSTSLRSDSDSDSRGSLTLFRGFQGAGLTAPRGL